MFTCYSLRMTVIIQVDIHTNRYCCWLILICVMLNPLPEVIQISRKWFQALQPCNSRRGGHTPVARAHEIWRCFLLSLWRLPNFFSLISISSLSLQSTFGIHLLSWLVLKGNVNILGEWSFEDNRCYVPMYAYGNVCPFIWSWWLLRQRHVSGKFTFFHAWGSHNKQQFFSMDPY